MNNTNQFSFEHIQVFDEIQSKQKEKLFLIENLETRTQYLQKINLAEDQNPNLYIPNIEKISQITKYPGLLPIVSFTAQPNSSIIYEYKENVTLKDFITRNRTESNFQQIFTNTKKYINILGIAYAIQYLHGHNIFINNIDSSDIYLDDDLYPHLLITPIMNDKTDYFISWQKDVYTFSFLAYEILTCTETNIEAVEYSENRPDLHLLRTEWQQQFVQKCWSKYDTQRPNIFDIIKELGDHKGDFGDIDEDEVKRYELTVERYLANYSKAVKKSASGKDRDWCFIYGNMLTNGYGVATNKIKAARYYRTSAEQGHGSSQFNYGLILDNFGGLFSKKKEAAKYYKSAIEQGHSTSMFNYALLLYNGEHGIPINKEESFELFKVSADLGNVNSMFNVAFMLEKGEGIESNKPEAIKYYKLAAEHGNLIAMNSYASMLKKGVGIDQNKREAAFFFKTAADLGNSSAMFNYACMLKCGNGIQKNFQEAFNYFNLAANLNNTSAVFNLALMLYNGEGVQVNKQEAASNFKKAADGGNVDAMFNYALMMKNGDGIEPNRKEAIKYFRMAANKGHSNAMSQYRRLTQFIRVSI